MAADISKITSFVKDALKVVLPTTEKVKQEVVQITQDVLDKSVKQEKIASRAIASQGQAIVNLQNGKLIQEITQIEKEKQVEGKLIDGFASVRVAVKKMPISPEKKEEILSDINSAIEERHIEANLAKKSAQDSAQTIQQLNPKDTYALKESLKAKHGDKLEVKHSLEVAYGEYSGKIKTLKSIWREASRNIMFNEDVYTGAEVYTPKMISDASLLTSDSFDTYLAQVIHAIKARHTTKGLTIAKQSISEFDVPEKYAYIKEKVLEEINAELELRQFTDKHGLKKAQESAEVFLDEKAMKEYHLKDNLLAKKQELYAKHHEQFESRPARKSAKVIIDQSPVDLGARKIALQEKYGDQQVIKYIMNKYNIRHDDAKICIEYEIENIAKQYGISQMQAGEILAKKARKPESSIAQLISETFIAS